MESIKTLETKNEVPHFMQRRESILDKAAEFRKKTASLFTNEEIDSIFNSGDAAPDNYESDVFSDMQY